MATIALLHAVLIGVASTAAEKLLPYLLESDDKQFKEMCKDVFEQSSKCDDVVISTETFKNHQRKYTPLLPKSTFSEAVADCVENSLSIIEMQKACSEVESLKKALLCYRESLLAMTPSHAQEVVDELITVFEVSSLPKSSRNTPRL